MTTAALDQVVTWHENEASGYVSPVRPGATAASRDFIDRERGIAFRISGGTKTRDEQQPDFFSPRHRHSFDQVRFYFSGQIKYGQKHVYGRGDCLYIPGGTWYGPMRPVETEESYKTFNLQYQGMTDLPYFSPTEFAVAREQLQAKGGSFEGGLYTGPDGRKQDGFEALQAELTGHEVTYPESMYDEYLTLHSGRLPWTPVPDRPGVEWKQLGHLTAVGPNLKLVRMAPGSSTPGGRSPFQQVRCLGEGSARFSDEPGRVFESMTFRYVAPNAEYGETVCETDAIILIVEWAPEGAYFLTNTAL